MESLLLRLGEGLCAYVSSSEVMVSIGPFSLVLSQLSLVLSKSSVFQHEGVLSVFKGSESNLRSSLECFVSLEIGLEVNYVLGGTSKVLLFQY